MGGFIETGLNRAFPELQYIMIHKKQTSQLQLGGSAGGKMGKFEVKWVG